MTEEVKKNEQDLKDPKDEIKKLEDSAKLTDKDDPSKSKDNANADEGKKASIAIPDETDTGDQNQKGNDFFKNLDSLVNKAIDEKLTKEEIESIQKAGSETYFNLIVKGKIAEINEYNSALFNIAGGQKEYESVLTWAKDNLTKEEKKEFNDIVQVARDPKFAKLAVKDLMSRYVQANGNPPKVTLEGSNVVSVSEKYNDKEEYFKDTRHIDYKRDAKFRAKVDAKRVNSGW